MFKNLTQSQRDFLTDKAGDAANFILVAFVINELVGETRTRLILFGLLAYLVFGILLIKAKGVK